MHVVLCSLFTQGWVILDAVGWVYVTHLLCEGDGTVQHVVLRDGEGSCLCKRLCCGLIVASSM